MIEIIDKVTLERDELNVKIAALIKFLSGTSPEDTVGSFQYHLLKKQVEYMGYYASVLNLRIDDLKDES